MNLAWSGECTEPSLVWKQFTTSICFEACDVQRFHSQEFCAWDQFCIQRKSMHGIVSYMIFPCHFTLLSKRKLQHVDCSVGQVGQVCNRYDLLSTLIHVALTDWQWPSFKYFIQPSIIENLKRFPTGGEIKCL